LDTLPPTLGLTFGLDVMASLSPLTATTGDAVGVGRVRTVGRAECFVGVGVSAVLLPLMGS